MKTRMKAIMLFMTALVMTMMLGVMVSAETVAPGKVTGVTQTKATAGSVTIQWDSQIDSRYSVELSIDGVTWTEVADTSLTYTIETGLTTGSAYYARVTAYRDDWSAGEEYWGPTSDVIQVVTTPADVTNLAQTAATINSFNFAWTPVSGATYYNVYKYASGIETFAGTTTAPNGMFTSVVANDFAVVVKAVKKSSSGFVTESYGKTLYTSDIKLVPNKITGVYISNFYESLKIADISWTRDDRAKGYQMEVYRGTSKTPIISGDTDYYSAEIKNFNKKYTYKIKIRAYTLVNGQRVYGEWSDELLVAQPKLSIKYVTSKKMKVSWNKVKNAKSYTLYMSTNKDSGFKKVKTTKKTSLTITKFKKKKIKKNKTYYFYVVVKTKDGKKAKPILVNWLQKY